MPPSWLDASIDYRSIGRDRDFSGPLLLLVAFVLYATAQQLPEMLAGYASQEDHDVGYLFFQLMTTFGTILATVWVLAGRSPYAVLAAALVGAVLAGLIALMTFGSPPVGPPLANLVAESDDLTRAIGPFGNPNYLGVFAAIASAAALGLATVASSRLTRAALITAALVLVATLALSLSRGAIVAILVGIASLVFSRSRAAAVAIMCLGIVGAVVVYPAFVEWRLTNLTGSASGAAYAAMTQSDQGRLAGVLAAPQLFMSSPIFGIGFGHYVPMSVLVTGAAPINAHNWYLTVLAEQGAVGMALVTLLAFTLVRDLRRRPPEARAVGFTVLGTLAAGSLFLEPPTSVQTIALPSIVLSAALASNWRRSRDEAGPVPWATGRSEPTGS